MVFVGWSRGALELRHKVAILFLWYRTLGRQKMHGLQKFHSKNTSPAKLSLRISTNIHLLSKTKQKTSILLISELVFSSRTIKMVICPLRSSAAFLELLANRTGCLPGTPAIPTPPSLSKLKVSAPLKNNIFLLNSII